MLPAFDFGAVGIQSVGPKLLQIVLEFAQTLSPNVIVVAVSGRADADEICRLQHLQMLRHGGPAYGVQSGQLPDRFRVASQCLEYVAARGVSERGQNFLVSHYLP